MMFSRSPDCKAHPGTKLRFFCKNEACSAKLCQFCVQESHQNHPIEDLSQILEALKERTRKQSIDKNLVATDLKSMLNDLEAMDKKALEKYNKLYLEEKKLEEQFEARSRKWLSIIKERSQRIHKHIIKLKAKIELKKESIGKDKESDEAINLAEWADEDIKKLVIHQSESLTPPKSDFRNNLFKISEEIMEFEELTLSTFQDEIFVNSKGNLFTSNATDPKSLYSTLRSVPATSVAQSTRANRAPGLKILIPETPAGDALNLNGKFDLNKTFTSSSPNNIKKLNTLAKEPTRERGTKLESYQMELLMKKAEVQRLEKTKERLAKTNREIQMQIEKQNQVLASNLAAFNTGLGKTSAQGTSVDRNTSPTKSPQKHPVSSTESIRIKVAENALAGILKQHSIDSEKQSLESLIGKVGEVCEQWRNATRKLEAEEAKKKHVKKQSSSASPQKYKKEIETLKVTNAALEENLASLKKELSISRTLVKANKAAYEKEREKVAEIEEEKEKLQRELKVVQDEFKRFKSSTKKKIAEYFFIVYHSYRLVKAQQNNEENKEKTETAVNESSVPSDKLEKVKKAVCGLKMELNKILNEYSESKSNIQGTMTALSVFFVSNRDAFNNKSEKSEVPPKDEKHAIEKLKGLIKKKVNGLMIENFEKINAVMQTVMLKNEEKILRVKESVEKIEFEKAKMGEEYEVLKRQIQSLNQRNNNEITVLSSENENLKATVAKLEQSVEEYKKTEASLKNEAEKIKASYEDSIQKLKVQYETQVKDMENTVKERQKVVINSIQSQTKELKLVLIPSLLSTLQAFTAENSSTKTDLAKKLATEVDTRIESSVRRAESLASSKLREVQSQHSQEVEGLQSELEKQKENIQTKDRKILELNAIIEVKDRDLDELQKEVKKTFADSEEYMKMVELLNNKDAELANNESQFNQMLAHISDLETEITELKEKLEEAEKVDTEKAEKESEKVVEVEKRNDELQRDYDNTRAELEQLQNEYLTLSDKYKQAIQQEHDVSQLIYLLIVLSLIVTTNGQFKIKLKMISSPYTTPTSHKTRPRFTQKYTSPQSGTKETLSDRFIPIRSRTNLMEQFIDEELHEPPSNSEEDQKIYTELLKGTFEKVSTDKVRRKLCFDETELLEANPENPNKIRTFRADHSLFQDPFIPPIFQYGLKATAVRKVPKYPSQVLDSPGLRDDPYRSIIDWSVLDMICVGIDHTLYLLNNMGTTTNTLAEFPKEVHTSSLAFNPSGNLLTVGLDCGNVVLLDPVNRTALKNYSAHSKQITCSCWNNEWIFSTGSLDGKVADYDTRANQSCFRVLETKSPVINAKWSVDGSILCTSMNDGKVLLWDSRRASPLAKLPEHPGTVRALAWSGDNFLASGCINGRIRIFDTKTIRCVKEIEADTGVWSLLFSKNTSELISGHGGTLNSITLWKMWEGAKVGTLIGHQAKVNHMVLSPDGETLLTAAGDETLRFWDLFPVAEKSKDQVKSFVMPSCMDLRQKYLTQLTTCIIYLSSQFITQCNYYIFFKLRDINYV
eukprot:TRINITY_DN2846_c0_g1_i1.p1 TRINITY_DN2846_c0_g1~~TRINITY_DN2846_c0_g1_i1.p1  ORF type:complete len:1530 (-),score=226.01 TRINITY_DN2846_c0_g1_i1:4946-9535(-)